MPSKQRAAAAPATVCVYSNSLLLFFRPFTQIKKTYVCPYVQERYPTISDTVKQNAAAFNDCRRSYTPSFHRANRQRFDADWPKQRFGVTSVLSCGLAPQRKALLPFFCALLLQKMASVSAAFTLFSLSPIISSDDGRCSGQKLNSASRAGALFCCSVA